MFRFLRACAAAALCCAGSATVAAEESITLDPQCVLALIHQQAPDLLIAQNSLERAEAEVDLARAWRSGPSIELDGGYRLDNPEDRWDRGIAIRQQLDLWRRERIALASAGHEEQQARLEALRASITAEGVALYYRAIYQHQRLSVLAESSSLHERLNGIAQKRERVGDIGALDVQMTHIALARSRAAEAQAQTDLQATIDELHILLGVKPEVSLKLSGTLSWQWDKPVWQPEHHPILTQMAAGKRRSNQAIANARAEQRPELEVGLGYAHEEGEDIIRAGIGITFGAPGRFSAAARAAQSDATAAIILYNRTALRLQQNFIGNAQRLHRLTDALAAYETATGDTIVDTTRLAEASYAKGAIPLSDVLSLKRELIDARLEHLGLQFTAIQASIETAAAAGSTPFTGANQSGTDAAAPSSTPKE